MSSVRTRYWRDSSAEQKICRLEYNSSQSDGQRRQNALRSSQQERNESNSTRGKKGARSTPSVPSLYRPSAAQRPAPLEPRGLRCLQAILAQNPGRRQLRQRSGQVPRPFGTTPPQQSVFRRAPPGTLCQLPGLLQTPQRPPPGVVLRQPARRPQQPNRKPPW